MSTPSFAPTVVLVGLPPATEVQGAAHLAWRLARAADATLRIAAAVTDPFGDVFAAEVGFDVDDLHRRSLERRQADLTAALDPILPPDALRDAITVQRGDTDQVIAHQAHRLGAGVVVLPGPATPGNRRVVGAARHVLRDLHLPVILSGPRAGEIERVVAAADLSFAAEPTIRFARELARLFGADLRVVHVATPPRAPGDESTSSEARERMLGAEVRAAEDMLEAFLPADVELLCLRGEVLPRLRAVADEAPSTLLVVGTQGRGWIHRRILGSTSEALLTDCAAAIAVVPVAPPEAT